MGAGVGGVTDPDRVAVGDRSHIPSASASAVVIAPAKALMSWFFSERGIRARGAAPALGSTMSVPSASAMWLSAVSPRAVASISSSVPTFVRPW